MPTIRVELFAGRTLEHQRALDAALTEATVHVLGGSPEAVDVVFQDVEVHQEEFGYWQQRARPGR